MGDIADDLNGLSAQAWVTTAYLITSTVSTPLYGKLSDLYGRKPVYQVAIAVFLVIGKRDNQWPANLFSFQPLIDRNTYSVRACSMAG